MKKLGRIVLVFFGAECFALFRLKPGRGMAVTLLVSLLIKHWCYQFLPVPQPLALVLHVAAYAALLHVALGLFGLARIRALMVPRWFTGRRWLSFGSGSDRVPLFVTEPVIALILMVVAVLTVTPNLMGNTPKVGLMEQLNRNRTVPQSEALGHVFVPFWHDFAPPVDAWGETVTVYGSRVPGWFHKDAFGWGVILSFIVFLGVSLHNRHFDWPESAQCLAWQRQKQKQENPGMMTFTTVEEVK